MLKKIQLEFPHKIIDDVLVKSQTIQDIKSISFLREQVQIEAEKLLEITKENSELLTKKAYRDGYLSGVNLVLTHLIEAIDTINSYNMLKQQKNIDYVRNILKKACEDPSVILNAFEHWVKELPEPCDEIAIHLPESFKIFHIDSNFKSLSNANIKISYHPGEQLIMYSGDKISEFSPPEFLEQISEELKPLNTWTRADALELRHLILSNIISDCTSLLEDE